MQFNEDEILLINLCKGLVEICDRINRGEPAYQVDAPQPFPQPLYEAFQGLTLKWIEQDGEIQHPSILSMVEAARNSVEAVEPDFSKSFDFPDEPQNQSYIPRLMVEIQRLNLPYNTYTLFRRFIAENPFPSEFTIANFIDKNPDVEPVKDLLKEAYREAPPQSQSVS
ncbi:MAG: hypothetical protein F6K40_24165 [Okeania sp. SIO3I5]|uniref:hypothetical protein n=1 Tax=Okeania sp. SIO3I5 TaxID=2607805 RepID=UPI0013BE1A10|nr:hypothetical protein [Okeania sp. SIO3I5]NEQ39178.1 hypothetical protein [Okeania sp. SIO3I5]